MPNYTRNPNHGTRKNKIGVNRFSLTKIKQLEDATPLNKNEALKILVEKSNCKELNKKQDKKACQNNSHSFVLLKNGAKATEAQMSYSNTCAFDTFMQCLLACCVNENFWRKVNELKQNHPIFVMLSKMKEIHNNSANLWTAR